MVPNDFIAEIYKRMDIGTGKDLEEYSINGKQIPYHLIDIINPSEDYSVYSFQKHFHLIYDKILNQNKIAILCGGTGLYIESILLNYSMSNIKPDYILRENLEKLSTKVDNTNLNIKRLNKKLKKI